MAYKKWVVSVSILAQVHLNVVGTYGAFEEDHEELAALIVIATNAQPALGEIQDDPSPLLSGDRLSSYRISQDSAYHLLSQDQYGDEHKQNARGNHAVIGQGGVHFKAGGFMDLSPGMESAVDWFYTLVGGGALVTPSQLLSIKNLPFFHLKPEIPPPPDLMKAILERKTAHYLKLHPALKGHFVRKPSQKVLQASRTIEGVSLETFLDEVVQGKRTLEDLDLESFSGHFIVSLLTTPLDGKPDNFMVRFDDEGPGYIVGIDNDLAFGHAITWSHPRRNSNTHSCDVKNILYCLKDLMGRPLSEKMRDQMLSLNPEVTLLRWLHKLQDQNQRYQDLYAQSFLSEDLYEAFAIKLIPGQAGKLLQTLKTLQAFLKDHSHASHDEILKALEPLTFLYYEDLRKGGLGSALDDFSGPHTPFEDRFDLRIRLPNNERLFKALRKERANALDYETNRTASIEEEVRTMIDAINWLQFGIDKLGLQKRADLLEEIAASFPEEGRRLAESEQEDLHLSQVISHHLSPQLIEVFGQGIEFEPPLHQAPSLLHQTVLKGKENEDGILLLITALSQKQSLEALDQGGNTPLDSAFKERLPTVVQHLVKLGAGQQLKINRFLEFCRDPQIQEIAFQGGDLSKTYKTLGQRNPEVAWQMTLETLLPLPGAKGTRFKTAIEGERLLPSTVYDQLWASEDYRQFKRINQFGRRHVGVAQDQGYGFFIKHWPEFPGLEYAVGDLLKRLVSYRAAPATELVRLKDEPYLISQAIPGKTLHEVLNGAPEQLAHLEPTLLSELLLATMLIMPEDGKPDNYIVEPLSNQGPPYRIVGIDNDHAFVPALAKEVKEGWTKYTVLAKSVLFCLDQMQDPIDENVRQQFLKLDPAKLLTQWLRELSGINSSYTTLFTAEEAKGFLNQKDFETFVGVPFTSEMLTGLYDRFIRLQNLLSENKVYTHLGLLAELEPTLGGRYQKGFETPGGSPRERFEIVDSKYYTQDKSGAYVTTSSLPVFLTALSVKPQPDTLELIRDGLHLGPNQSLETLLSIIEASTKKDLGESLEAFQTLKSDEQKTKFLLNLKFKSLTVPKQQAWLRELQKIENLRALPLKGSNALTDDFFKNHVNLSLLTRLDLTNCPQVTDQLFALLEDRAPGLTHLILAEAPNLKKALKTVRVGGFFNRHDEVRRLKWPQLIHLDVSTTPLTHIFISPRPALRS